MSFAVQAEHLEIPAHKTIHVILLVSRIRPRPVSAGAHAALLALANLPILLGGQLPEGQQLVQIVIAARHGPFRHEPRDADGGKLRPSGEQAGAAPWGPTGLIPKAPHPRTRHRPP